MRWLIAATLLVLSLPLAFSHEKWADGTIPPAWVKAACCGQADAHILGSNDYWIDAHGFHVVGIDQAVPIDKVLPSQDGKVWAFYNVRSRDGVIHCVFYSGSI